MDELKTGEGSEFKRTFETLAAALSQLEGTVSLKLEEIPPKILLEFKEEGGKLFRIFLKEDVGQGAFWKGSGIALSFEGQSLGPNQVTQLEAIKKVLISFKQPLIWPKGRDDFSNTEDEKFSLRPIPGGTTSKWLLVVRANCIQHCQFCLKGQHLKKHGPGNMVSLEEAKSLFLKSVQKCQLKKGEELTIGGDEPLAWPPFLEFLKWMREQGFGPFRLQSVGWPLAWEGGQPVPNTEKLVKETGAIFLENCLEKIDIPLYSASPDLHNKWADHPQAFQESTAAIQGFLAAGLEVNCHTVLFEDCLADLPSLGKLMKEFGVHSWSLFPQRPLEGASIPSPPSKEKVQEAVSRCRREEMPTQTHLNL